MIDATGEAARPDMTVVINGNRITEVGESERIRVPRDAQVVVATGKFLIPGLWDMHVHPPDEPFLPLFIANEDHGHSNHVGLSQTPRMAKTD